VSAEPGGHTFCSIVSLCLRYEQINDDDDDDDDVDVQVLPTTVRSVGLGMCSSVARIGALLTPFVAQVCTHHCGKILILTGCLFYHIL